MADADRLLFNVSMKVRGGFACLLQAQKQSLFISPLEIHSHHFPLPSFAFSLGFSLLSRESGSQACLSERPDSSACLEEMPFAHQKSLPDVFVYSRTSIEVLGTAPNLYLDLNRVRTK